MSAVANLVTPVSMPHHSKANKDFCQAARTLDEAGRFDAASKLEQSWKKAHPHDPDAYTAMARTRMLTGDIDGAIQDMHTAIHLNPQYSIVVVKWMQEATTIRQRYPHLHLYPVSLVQGQSQRAENTLQMQSTSLLRAGRFDEIERIAAQLLASRAELPSGRWKLTAFAEPLWLSPSTDAEWKRNHALLTRWHAQHPSSSLALIALARSWTVGASIVRGGGWANTVSQDQWKVINARLSQGVPLFSAAMGELTRTPLLFSGLQIWGQMNRMPRADYEKLWQQAATAFPGYVPFYTDKAQFLMTRWYGQPGEWETFATQSADAIGGIKGDMLYARIMTDQNLYYKDLFAENNLSWSRAKRGYQALITRGIDPISDATDAVQVAGDAHDNAFARDLLTGPLSHHVASSYGSLAGFTHQRISLFTH